MNVLNKIHKSFALLAAFLALSGCNRNFKDVVYGDWFEKEQPVAGLRAPSSIIVCRSKQCAPAKLSMSREYIYNSLLHLFENNNHQTALICQANAASHACVENYITMPIRVGITPAYMYIDSIKITDVIIGRRNDKVNLVLNYNVTYNGQSPDCTPSKSILFAKNVNHVLLEDAGYNCKMTAIGQTTIKNVFSIDYIDLDYGYIGGYYSVGLSGPAYGGGTGYMIIRLPKNAYPLAPVLKDVKDPAAVANNYTRATSPSISAQTSQASTVGASGVQIFPIAAKKSEPVYEETAPSAGPSDELDPQSGFIDSSTTSVEAGGKLSDSIPQ